MFLDPKIPRKFSIVTERAQGGALDQYIYKNKVAFIITILDNQHEL